MKNEYEINNGTLALISLKDGNTRIMEDNKNYIIAKNSFNVLEHSCKYFGSSYEGRKEGAKSLIGANYKVPIVIQDSLNLVFFPTSSPVDNDCVWLAVNRIERVEEKTFNTTKIIFDNGRDLVVSMSYRSIENQILRATRLSYLIKERKMKVSN